MNEPRQTLDFQLTPQVPDINLDDVTLPAKIVAPDSIKDKIARQHIAGVAHEQFKQFILFGRQLDGSATTTGLTRTGVKFQVRKPEDLGLRRCSPSQQCTDSC